MKIMARQQCHKLKKKIEGQPANQIPTTSLVSCMDDEEWRALVNIWSSNKNKVCGRLYSTVIVVCMTWMSLHFTYGMCGLTDSLIFREFFFEENLQGS